MTASINDVQRVGQRTPKMTGMTARQLIENPANLGPHVVVLGAGASRASFPDGDATGKLLPVMNDLVEKLGLQPLISRACPQTDSTANFELIYNRLVSDPACSSCAREIERRIHDYFSDLSLPNCATIYDRILISLRSTDAVFTFNWDPFLFDAYERNRHAVRLPNIFFLHGNVRIGACETHDRWGFRNQRCSDCGERFVDVPLLYPIDKKNYAQATPYTQRALDEAKARLTKAFTLTIFGYGAPESDREAIALLQEGWFNNRSREFEHVEIIDTAPQSSLHERWSAFTPTHHLNIKSAFEQSQLARWPRRSTESLFYPMSQGAPCKDFPLPMTNNLAELQACAAEIALHERA